MPCPQAGRVPAQLHLVPACDFGGSGVGGIVFPRDKLFTAEQPIVGSGGLTLRAAIGVLPRVRSSVAARVAGSSQLTGTCAQSAHARPPARLGPRRDFYLTHSPGARDTGSRGRDRGDIRDTCRSSGSALNADCCAHVTVMSLARTSGEHWAFTGRRER